MPTPKRLRDKADMAQKTREWRARQRALLADWPTRRTVLHSQATVPPSAPVRAARERPEISYFVKFHRR